MSKEWTEAEIAARVDGSLDPAEAERIDRILATDPAARCHAELIRGTNRLLQSAFAGPAEEPVPAQIKATILGTPDTVVPLPKRRPTQAAWRPVALAASFAALIAVGVASLVFRGDGIGTIAALGDADRDGPLHEALETLPSGTISTEGVRPMLTFRDRDRRLCREFEVVGELPGELELGIACRVPGGLWHVEITVVTPAADGSNPEDGYAPAAGPASNALDAMLDAIGAGPPLPPEDEAILLETGWTEPAG